MRRTFLAILASMLFASPVAAEGGNPFWGPAQKLVFVTDTQFNGKSGSHALCVEVTDDHFFYLPTKRTVGDYVFSQTNCTTTDVVPVPLARLPMLKAAGVLPNSVPDTPQAPLTGPRMNKSGILMLLLFCAGGGWFLQRPARKASRRLSNISGDPLFFDVLLTVMFHIARIDGAIEKDELRAIMRVYKNLTGTPLTAEVAATKFGQSITDETLLQLAKRYRGAHAQMMCEAAVQIATHSGAITREKRALLTALCDKWNHDKVGMREAIIAATQGSRNLQTA